MFCPAQGVAVQREKPFALGAFRKYKVGRSMARSKVTPEDLRKVRELATEWGKIVARRAGDAATELDFTAIEDLAAAAAAGLTEGTIAAVLDKQAQTLPAELPCPDCGRLCPVGRADRDLTVRAGQTLPLSEPVCHCPDCRRDFFPPPHAAASGQPRLQPGRPAADR
jgi:Zn finger protein HypA/HybF involved in hydrogenase expression